MAGIITNVDSDVQKLRKLKNEIEEVKKALKSINIKVDINIAEGLQSQLKSLTVQYNELVNNIAQAEAKILLSAKKINDASEKIIQAQEKMSKTAGTPTQIGSTKSQGANAIETASIQAQAKAYEDLKAEINGILGTREANVKRMVDEMNSIRLINAEIKKITKSQGESASLSSAQQKRLEQLNNSLLTHKTALSEVRQTLNNNVKLDNAAATSMNGLSQSLSRMRIAYRELTEEERNSPIGKDLLTSINQADAKIKELDATIGNHQRNVGDYAKQWNGLQYQMQMVARELPNFAINPQIGIMSLTNNLPYLVDELKKAKDAHKAYIAEVKAGNKDLKAIPSVGKQVLSSLLNWQTAIIMGITLITAYRKEISEWVTGLFKANGGIKSLKDAERDINEKFIESTKVFGQQIVKLRELQERWKSLGNNIDAQKKFVQDAKTDFTNLGASVNTVNDAENLLVKNTPAFIEALKLRAQAAAAKELSEEKYKEYLSKRQKALDESQSGPSISDKLKRIAYNIFEPSTSGVINTKEQEDILKSFQGQRIKSLMDEAEAAKADAESYFTLKQAKEEAAAQKIDSILPDGKIEIKNKDFWTTQLQEAEKALSLIESSQFELLKKTAKDPKKDLYGLSIDKTVVDSYKKAVKDKAEAEKELKTYDTSSKQDSEAEKQIKQQQKSAEELLSLRRQNQQDEINLMKDGADKRLKQIELDYQQELDAIRKKEQEWSKANGGKLTEEQSVQISLSYSQAEGKRDKSISDVNKEELEAMNRYLKEYGTFQQQKLAIAEEYAEKIRKAQSEGERLSLVKQRDAALQQVEVKAIKQSIDWGSVFGEFGAMFKDQLQPTIDKLKSIAQSDEFKSSSLQDQQTLYELISKLEQSNAAWDSNIFQKVSDDMTAYQTAMQNHLKAQERERLATEALALAKRDLAAAEQSGNGTDALNAQAKVTEAQLALNAAARDVQDFGTQVQETTSDLQASSIQAVNMFQNLESGLKGLTSGSLQGVGQGLMQLDKLFNKGGITKDVGNALASGFQSLLGKDSKASKAISEALGSAGMAGEIISGVLGILDLLKDGFSNIFVSLQDTVFGAVEGILNDVFSGDIIVKPLENSVKHVGTILDTITFGGFSNWLGSGDSDKNLERDIEYLTQSNQDLRNALDNLSDKMDKASVIESNDIYKVQKENLKKQEANTRESMQRSAAAYSNGFLGIGGSHSSNNKIDNGMSGSEWKKVSEIVGSSVKNAGQFFQLSSEQMAKLAEEDTTLYSKIKDLANDGYKDASQYMDEYITYYRQLEELENAYNEKLTNTSFDSVRNDFKNALLDMESDAEDFANNFEKMMQNAIVESLMTKKYDKFLQEWYEEFAKAMEGDGKIDDDEQRKLQNRWNSITSQALAERDALKDAMGWEVSSDSSTSQSSTKGYSTTASQDSIDEANGRMTALQTAGEEIKNQNIIQTQSLNLLTMKADAILAVNTEAKNIADDTRDLIANSYLELVQISENTGNSAKYLKDIRTDIAEVKKNTSKL